MQSRVLIVSVLLAVLISISASAQMYNQQTVYTDCEAYEGSATIHAWGYTYAPSGNSLLHTYNTHTKIVLPSGSSAENWASGSGYSPATANVYITVPLSDLVNGIAGDVNLTSDHTAYCPGAGTNFLNNQSRFFPIKFTITTMRGTGSSGDLCYYVPACSSGSPTCGSTSITVVGSGNCCIYASSYFLVAKGNCIGLGLNTCVVGPGICT